MQILKWMKEKIELRANKSPRLRRIDMMIYIVAIFCDSFGIAMMTKTSFGATPFGIFITNAVLIIPLSVGMISLMYEIIYIVAASRIGRTRIKYELLIYSVIFAVMIDLHMLVIPDLSHLHLVWKLVVTLLAIVFIDVAKALFNITVYPKLSVVEFIYAIVNRYKLRLDYVQKSISLFNVAVGILFSFMAGKLFNNIGIGTIVALFAFGTVLHKVSGPIEKAYKKVLIEEEEMSL